MSTILTDPESLSEFGDGPATARDTVFELLANRRRREVLRSLDEMENPVSIGDLAAEIAYRETNAEMNAISDHGGASSEERRRIRIDLHHHHVPKLAAYGAVEYDSEADAVALRERGRALLDQLEATRELLWNK